MGNVRGSSGMCDTLGEAVGDRTGAIVAFSPRALFCIFRQNCQSWHLLFVTYSLTHSLTYCLAITVSYLVPRMVLDTENLP